MNTRKIYSYSTEPDDVLEERTRILGASEGEADGRMLPVLTVSCADRTYVVPAHQVRRVTFDPRPLPVPGAMAGVQGILNLDGQIIPVVDLSLLIGGIEVPKPAALLVVSDPQEEPCGFALAGIPVLYHGAWERGDQASPCGDRTCEDGWCTVDETSYPMLSLEALFSLPSWVAYFTSSHNDGDEA